jgi:hypothetical protein
VSGVLGGVRSWFAWGCIEGSGEVRGSPQVALEAILAVERSREAAENY